jgi:hypothetical protein
MLVLLKNNWFGPGGVYYPYNKLGTNIPDELCKQDANGKWLDLPSATRKMAKQPKPEPVVDLALKDMDLLRAQGDAISQAAETANTDVPQTKEQKRLAKAAALREQLDAEAAALRKQLDAEAGAQA